MTNQTVELQAVTDAELQAAAGGIWPLLLRAGTEFAPHIARAALGITVKDALEVTTEAAKKEAGAFD